MVIERQNLTFLPPATTTAYMHISNEKYCLHDQFAQLLSISLSMRVTSSIPRLVKLEITSPTVRHSCDVSREMVAQALSRGDGPRHSYTLRRNTASVMKI